MTQSAECTATVEWNITVPSDFDEAVRIFLTTHAGSEGSLSSLIQKSISLFILSALTRESKEAVRTSGQSQDELNTIITDGLAQTKNHPQ